MKKQKLTKALLIQEAKIFALSHSKMTFPEMYGVTDGKAVGTFIEHKFREYLTTKYKNNANIDDLVAFMHDRNLPLDDIEANEIAEDLLKKKPKQGYLTISNALQWRLQYSRVIQVAGKVQGVHSL